jgi:phosphate transport system substrate-binding protein
MVRSGWRWLTALVVILAFSLTALGVSAQGAMTLNGAGATFPFPLYSKAFSEYTKLHPEVQINYQSVGSGAGIQQLTQKTVDFGASDAPMTEDQLQAVGGADAVVHIPATLGAVAITYNLPGVQEPLKFDGATLGDIFLGTITSWDDPKIAALNSGVTLPSTAIVVVHRSDGSGTTNIFTTYLSSVSPDWKDKVGAGLSVEWPVGIGAKGNEGVAGQAKQVEGGIAYVELAYAQQNKLSTAEIENSAKAFVAPSPEGATACADAAAPTMPDDLRVMIAGCTGNDATIYPISGFSWIILYKDQTDAARGQALVNVIDWLIHDGQQFGPDLSYAPLPEPVVELGAKKLGEVTANGEPLLQVAATPTA